MADSRDLPSDPDRNLALELVRVTEAAAIAAGRFMGRGDKERVDQAAVDAMRPVLASIAMSGVVVIEAPIEDNLAIIAGARRKRPDDITVAILDRPRHADLVKRVLSTGARIKFLLDGDVGGAILAADEGSTVDVLVGIGGTPEGVIAACAMKCLDGAIFGKLYPRNDEERQAALDAGYDLDKVLTTDDLVAGNDVFFAATGVTDGELLRGVRYTPQRVLTQSLSMRSKSGAIRVIEGRHHAQRSNLIRAGG